MDESEIDQRSHVGAVSRKGLITSAGLLVLVLEAAKVSMLLSLAAF